MSRPQRAPRADNRLPALLDEAARLFGAQGFHGTSIRDIVRSVPMLPGSVYYHFATKDLLLVAVFDDGDVELPANATATVAQSGLLGSLHVELAAPTGVAPPSATCGHSSRSRSARWPWAWTHGLAKRRRTGSRKCWRWWSEPCQPRWMRRI